VTPPRFPRNFRFLMEAAAAFAALGAGLLFSPAHAQRAPKELQPPPDERLLLRAHAEGFQIYACKDAGGKFNWALVAPEALLTDKNGRPFGKHFAGPAWEATDGSRVTGKAAANAPSPDADSIPWLLIAAVGHHGEGVLARVDFIQRVNTKGGKTSPSGCDAAHDGQERREPYSADYLFFTIAKSHSSGASGREAPDGE
jgi:hypothetical protein